MDFSFLVERKIRVHLIVGGMLGPTKCSRAQYPSGLPTLELPAIRNGLVINKLPYYLLGFLTLVEGGTGPN